MTQNFDTFPLQTLTDLANAPDPDWLIDDVLPDKGLGVLFGKSGAGKSFLALDWALSIAAGVPWLDKQVRRPGFVLYIAAEGQRGMKLRTEAWRSARNLTPEAEDRLLTRFRLLPDAVNLLDPKMVERLRRTLAALPEEPVLLVADTVARSMSGGDENSAKDVGTLVAAIDGLLPSGHRLVVHHAGLEDGRERGSTSLPYAADVRLELRADGRQVTLSCKKQKDAEEFEDLSLRLEKAGVSCVLKAKPSSQPHELGPTYADRVETFLAAEGPCSKNAVSDGVPGKRTAILDTIDALAEEGRIAKVEGGWALVPEGGNHPPRSGGSHGGSRTPKNLVPMRREPPGTTLPGAATAGGSPGGRPFRGAPEGTAGSSNPSLLASSLVGFCDCDRPLPIAAGATERCLLCERPIAIGAVT